MDMLLLSRVSLLAGKMMSNFPRVALQMRVQMPTRRRLPSLALHANCSRHHHPSQPVAYVALDDRPWCSRTSCREPFPTPREQHIAMRRELARNPIIPP